MPNGARVFSSAITGRFLASWFMRVLIALLVAGVTAPVPAEAASAAGDPVIRSVTLSPDAPVVGPAGAVRLVIEVVARGVADPAGVTIEVEPGSPPRSGPGSVPAPRPAPRPGPGPEAGPVPGPGPVPVVDRGSAASVPPHTATPSVTGPGLSGPGGRPAGGSPAPRPVSRAEWGWETWRFLPDRELTRWYPAGRWTVTVTARGAGGARTTRHAGFWLRRETRFSAVQAVGRGSDVRVRGVLNRVDPQGYLDYAPFPGKPVEILYRQARGSGWERVASATTDPQGRFIRTVTGRRGGEWRIRFAGTGHYAARLSAVHQIRPEGHS